MWMTQMVNNLSFDLEAAAATRMGQTPRPTINWVQTAALASSQRRRQLQLVEGRGSAIDFSTPMRRYGWRIRANKRRALRVRRGRLRSIDFGEDYITDDPIMTAQGPTPLQQYSEAYYHDYTSYAVAARGDDFVSMTRAWDASYGFAGRFYAKKEDSRVAWMGGG